MLAEHAGLGPSSFFFEHDPGQVRGRVVGVTGTRLDRGGSVRGSGLVRDRGMSEVMEGVNPARDLGPIPRLPDVEEAVDVPAAEPAPLAAAPGPVIDDVVAAEDVQPHDA